MKITQKIKRKAIQIAAFGLSNVHVGNFAGEKGASIYTGPWKQFCNPGLHCYSCPAASVSCPIGALQAVTGSMKFDFSFYVVGLLLAMGVVLGRWICGFLCPFGLVQELLAKIPLPRKKLRLPRPVKYLKYLILLVFVVILPVAVTNIVGMGQPAFCQYICPSGMLFGAIPLLGTHPELQTAIGWLFSWKMLILVGTVVGCVLVHRLFCKALCPLGAIYGVMNKVSFYRLRVDESKCIHCGKCAKVCMMDVDPVRHPQSMECIRCGACAAACPTGAIRLGFGVFKKKEEAKPSGSCGGNCAGCKGCGG